MIASKERRRCICSEGTYAGLKFEGRQQPFLFHDYAATCRVRCEQLEFVLVKVLQFREQDLASTSRSVFYEHFFAFDENLLVRACRVL